MTSSDSNGLRGHYPARRDVEKSATADAHISQLRHEIESRLRINLPEDISSSLADGVILCHIANHVRPRAVPSIHVPSPSVVSKFSDLLESLLVNLPFSLYIFTKKTSVTLNINYSKHFFYAPFLCPFHLRPLSSYSIFCSTIVGPARLPVLVVFSYATLFLCPYFCSGGGGVKGLYGCTKYCIKTNYLYKKAIYCIQSY